jgi:hypothetical protein
VDAAGRLLDRAEVLHYRPRAVKTRSVCFLGALVAVVVWVPAGAFAQEVLPVMEEEAPPGLYGDETGGDPFGGPESPADPPRIVWSVGGGSAFRLIRNLDYNQEFFAPAFVDAFGAFVFGAAGVVRHGVGLGASLNLTGDGDVPVGVDGFTQVVVAPSYLLYLRLSDTVVVHGKVAVNLNLSPSFVPGAEIAGGLTLLLTAGFGLYGEIGVSAYINGDSTVHPLVSAEGGVAFDFEILPSREVYP